MSQNTTPKDHAPGQGSGDERAAVRGLAHLLSENVPIELIYRCLAVAMPGFDARAEIVRRSDADMRTIRFADQARRAELKEEFRRTRPRTADPDPDAVARRPAAGTRK